MAKTPAPPPVYTIPPLQPRKRGKSDAELIREAKAGTITWQQAQAGLVANGHPARDAVDIIATAQKAPSAKPAYTGPTASDILRQAVRTKDWAAARAALLQIPNYSPAKADIQIQNAQASVAKKATVSQGTITKTLSPASTTTDQAAATAALVKTGYSPQDAAKIVQASVTPQPYVPPISFITSSLEAGTMSRDEATLYFQQLGLSPELQKQYLALAHATSDKWAVLGADGRIKFTPITSEINPPKNVLTYGPTPLTQSSFQQVWTQTYKDTYLAYTGKQASGKEIAQILKTGPSVYALSNKLASSPGFAKSPIYKQHAPGVIEYAKSKLGQSWKPDPKLVSDAISQSWDQATLDAHLKQLPAYLHGPEFQDGAAKKAAVYQSIYGVPDVNALHTIGQAQLQGWSDDEFAQYLRAQPQYTKSPEYLSKILSFGQALGMITGQQPGLVTGGSANGQPFENPNPPSKLQVADNPRLPAPAPVESPINYMPTRVA